MIFTVLNMLNHVVFVLMWLPFFLNIMSSGRPIFLHVAGFPYFLRTKNINHLNGSWGKSWNMCHHYKSKRWKREGELKAPWPLNGPSGRYRRFLASALSFVWSNSHYLWAASISDKMCWKMMDFFFSSAMKFKYSIIGFKYQLFEILTISMI